MTRHTATRWRARTAVRCASVVTLTAGLLGVASGAADAARPAVTFSSYAAYPTGIEPRSAVVGDLNGDAIPDLAAVTTSPSVVQVQLGTGDGTLAPAAAYETGVAPKSVVIGDLNGDGIPDLATANQGSPCCAFDGSVSVLLGNGDGSFAPHTEHLAGPFPYAMAIGDLNGDTHLDLAVTNPGSIDFAYNMVSVVLGNGDGTFGGGDSYLTGDGPASVAIADLNGDGRPDLVTANAALSSGSSSLSVLLATAGGTFSPHAEYAVGNLAVSVAVADVNGDSALDLAVANGLSASVSVLLGNGDGTFDDDIQHPTGEGPASVVVTDLNGDTYLDLATPSSTSDKVSVLLGNGDATFDAHTDHPTPPGPNSVAVGDLDGDGRPDLVTTNETGPSPSVSVLLNTTVPVVPSAPTIGAAVAGDGEATVSWTAPASNGGSPITGYVVTPYVGFSPQPPQTFPSTATTQVVTGLTNSTQYRFRVQALNMVGTSGYSTVTNPVIPAPAGQTVPGAPTIGSATAGDQSATVSWTAPSSDGGTPLTGYVVTPYVGYSPQPAQTFSSTDTTQVVTGLTNGTTYRFRVRAINAIGTSAYSKVTNPVIPTPP